MRKMATRLEQKVAKAEAKARAFNEQCAVGDAVEVTRDDGTKERRATRSEAWALPCGEPVVLLTGIAGGYALGRVRPL